MDKAGPGQVVQLAVDIATRCTAQDRMGLVGMLHTHARARTHTHTHTLLTFDCQRRGPFLWWRWFTTVSGWISACNMQLREEEGSGRTPPRTDNSS